MMNASGSPVVAVDIPSGADADAMGPQKGTIARADAMVTFTAPRPAHVFSRLRRADGGRGNRFARRGDYFVAATERDYSARFCGH